MLNRLFVTVDNISKWGAIAAALQVAAIAVMILAEISARSLFNYSLSFAWEYSAYCMAMAIFCGAAYTLRTGGHIRVSLLSSSLPAKWAWGVDILATILGCVISSFLSLALIQLAWRSFLSGSTSATISATPLAIPQGIIALGALFLTLQLLLRVIRLLTGVPTEDLSDGYQVE